MARAVGAPRQMWGPGQTRHAWSGHATGRIFRRSRMRRRHDWPRRRSGRRDCQPRYARRRSPPPGWSVARNIGWTYPSAILLRSPRLRATDLSSRNAMLGMQPQRVNEIGKEMTDRCVSGQQHRHHVGDDLGVGQRRARFLCFYQNRKVVGPVAPSLSSCSRMKATTWVRYSSDSAGPAGPPSPRKSMAESSAARPQLRRRGRASGRAPRTGRAG